MDKVEVGIIGIGNMGSFHANYIAKGEIPGAELIAVCDTDPDRIKWARENLGDEVLVFDNADAFFESGCADAVLIATPHYDHPTLAIKAFYNGLHVLI